MGLFFAQQNRREIYAIYTYVWRNKYIITTRVAFRICGGAAFRKLGLVYESQTLLSPRQNIYVYTYISHPQLLTNPFCTLFKIHKSPKK